MENYKSGNELRKLFLEYFQEKGHTGIPSSPLIPNDDPSLLFTNAGMVQFKRVFLGEEKRSYTRATTSQKCLRVGGKHNDLENVGHTARHHTFFEMLGNFSFGDYFKEDAIKFAWEFLTDKVGLDKNKLYATVFETDDEAYGIWKNVIGLPKDRIVRLGEKDNFWSMGETGPCGPCSEIIYDQGEDFPCEPGEDRIDGECDRFLEIWNLVFMQYNRDGDGKLTPLPKPSIDTGMGLERLAAVVQNVRSNFESDFFKNIINKIEDIAGVSYKEDEKTDVAINVIADHARAITFLIADGILPSNEGRNYILRRIIRRAVRFGRLIGLSKPFLFEVCSQVIDDYKEFYRELEEKSNLIIKVVHGEEERFEETLEKGLRLFDEEISRLTKENSTKLSGKFTFKLYDTFGFPFDLTQLMADENGFTVNEEDFNKEMELQRERARTSWKGDNLATERNIYAEINTKIGKTKFTGYEKFKDTGKIVAIIKDGKLIDKISGDEEFELITDSTPFYGESGGQKGDSGSFNNDSVKGAVTTTKKPLLGLTVHLCRLDAGELRVGEVINLEINKELRMATMANHTATHLLHKALRTLLGEHVKQAGSLVSSDKLRFDFSHFESVKTDEIIQIEKEVNRKIFESIKVFVKEMNYHEALETGAMALFEEKYGETVRVISIGDYSSELCGGTHVSNSSEIGFFRIISEGAVAAGIRRIEAVTKFKALDLILNEKVILNNLVEQLGVETGNLTKKTEALMLNNKELLKEITQLKKKIAQESSKDLMSNVVDVNGINYLPLMINATDNGEIRELADQLKSKISSGIIAIGSNIDGKAVLVVSVTNNLTDKISAGEILKTVSPIFDGRGGGKPGFAQAGGKNPAKLNEALDEIKKIIENK